MTPMAAACRRPLFAVFSAVAVAAVVSGCGGTRASSSSSLGSTTASTTQASPAVHRRPIHLSFTALIAHVRTGIVRIETTTCGGGEIGTGFLIGPRLIATVEHVVDGASSIALKQNGKVVAEGAVIGTDSARDVALIRSDKPIQGYDFKFFSRTPALGSDVTAIGFPLGLPLTVTRGTISGLDRTIPIDGIKRTDLVQTDAPVNPGNSGGPLITDTGYVIGLVDLGTTQANGLAFAVNAQVADPLLASWKAAPQPLAYTDCGSGSAASTPVAAPPTSSPAPNQVADAAAIATIRTHWQLVNDGEYAQAYQLFSPRLQSTFGESGWVADKQRDRPTASAIQISGASVIGNSVVVSVSFTTVGLETGAGNNGCNGWNGTYTMVDESGQWLIDATNLQRTELTC